MKIQVSCYVIIVVDLCDINEPNSLSLGGKGGNVVDPNAALCRYHYPGLWRRRTEWAIKYRVYCLELYPPFVTKKVCLMGWRRFELLDTRIVGNNKGICMGVWKERGWQDLVACIILALVSLFSPPSLLARMSSLQYTAINDIPKTIKELRYQFDSGEYKMTFIAWWWAISLMQLLPSFLSNSRSHKRHPIPEGPASKLCPFHRREPSGITRCASSGSA